MTLQHRDDSPDAFLVTRREALTGGVFLGVAFVIRSISATDVGNPKAFDDDFMALSRLLIPHRLNPDVGERIAMALAGSESNLHTDITSLLAIAKRHAATQVEDFFDFVPQGRAKQLALKIISAWYLGVTNDQPGASVCTFELALMFGPTRDVMPIPSYAISGPNGWTADSPSLNAMPDF